MKSILLTFLLSFSFILSAQNIKITHGPYLCDMTQDAVTVVWTTDKPALSWVELAVDDGKSFYAEERPKFHEVANGRRQAYKTLHKIRLTNLTPGEKYCYRVYSKEVVEWSGSNNIIYGRTVATDVYNKAPLKFKTFEKNTEDVSFIVLNDIHGRATFMKDLCKEVDFKKMDFVMLNGDMANSIENEEQIFTDFIDASVDLYASETPLMYCRGNHETRGKFADFLPNYLPMEDSQFYHFYLVGNTAFLVLDCGEDKPDNDIEYAEIADFDSYREEQAKWLSKVIDREEFKNAKNRIVFLHIPPMVGNWHGNSHLKELFIPLLNKANIDVMFSGHIHRYAYYPADDKVSFPTVVNSNNSLVKCKISSAGIDVEIVDTEGKVEHKHTF